MERDDIIKKHPDARFVCADCVAVEKGIQKSGLRKCKSRLVALRN